MRRRATLAALALLAGLVPFLGTAQADPPTHATGYIPVAVGTLDEAELLVLGRGVEQLGVLVVTTWHPRPTDRLTG